MTPQFKYPPPDGERWPLRSRLLLFLGLMTAPWLIAFTAIQLIPHGTH
jgi:hypothetical protein